MKHIFRQFLWRLFLPEDWYMVAVSDSDVLQAAHWNGTTWTQRLWVRHDETIIKVVMRVPRTIKATTVAPSKCEGL